MGISVGDFLTKKWGFIQEKPQKQDFSITWGSIQEWGCNQADTVYQRKKLLVFLLQVKI